MVGFQGLSLQSTPRDGAPDRPSQGWNSAALRSTVASSAGGERGLLMLLSARALARVSRA